MGNVSDWFVEFEMDVDGFVCVGGFFVKGFVGEFGVLFLGEFFDVVVVWEFGVVGDVGGGEFDFCFLFWGGVYWGNVGGEGVGEELGFFLFDGGGKGWVCFEDVVVDVECLLCVGGEGFGKLDVEVLGVIFGVEFDVFGDEWFGVGVFVIFYFDVIEVWDLIGCEGEVVFILWFFVDIFYDDIDVFFDVVFFDGNNVDEVGVFEDLWGFEGRWECWFGVVFVGVGGWS